MEANELRLGNLVTATLTNEIYEIGIWALRVIEDGNYQNSYDTETKVYEPIPLTEEWLLKFDIIKLNFTTDMPKSFQKPDIDEDGNIWYTWVKGAFNLEIQKNGEIWFEVYSHYIHVKYVHQLQNLYFALTSEELTIKE